MMLYVIGVVAVLLVYTVLTLIPLVKSRYATAHILSKYYPLKPHWFWGHLKQLHGPNEAGIRQGLVWTENYPFCYAVKVGQLITVLDLNHPDTVKLMLKGDEPKSMSIGSPYGLLLPWIGRGLILSNGEKWFRNRRLLTPAFHFDVLKPYIDVYNESTNALIEEFEIRAKSGKSVEITELVNLCTLEIILKCAFTYENSKLVDNKAKSEDEFNYVKSVHTIAHLISDRVFEPMHYLDTVYYRTEKGKSFMEHCHISHKQADEVIQKRRQKLTNGQDPLSQKKYIDFLDILLLAKDQDGKGLTDEEIRDEVETFMFAGHDTTSSGISWILYNLARHPEVQKKAYEEVSKTLGHHQQQVKWEHLSQMKYLTMCIKESLRLHPPVFIITRQSSKQVNIRNDIIPKGTVMNINIYNTHHNPKVWGDDHMTYDPDRFLPDNMAKMDPYAFIPFSAGPRNCIGQTFAMNEIKTAVALILNKFQMSVDPNHVIELKPEITLKAKYGIMLQFEKRF